ncbi:MAG TPA: hypothetical protein PLF47_11625, partial [Dokdonella sp.]|nr:hypothetical protein [Dokdonella sp.]
MQLFAASALASEGATAFSVEDAPAKAAAVASPTPAPADGIDIPFTRFTLPNGLTAVVHEDHKAPVVAVSIWYHVGSGD